MSWIDDEARENFKNETDEENRQRLIATSNYWEKLVRQVETDVNEINANSHWKKKLPGDGLAFGSATSGAGYAVSKPGKPGVVVTFRHDGEEIVVTRRFFDNNPVVGNFKQDETLQVTVSGENVVLQSPYVQGRVFIVPKEASQYILRAVIESLKITKAST